MSTPTPHPATDPRHEPGRALAASPQGARGAGPVVLLVPICALLAFALWREAGGNAPAGRQTSTEPPPSERAERVVDGWAGSFTVPGETPYVVEARLAPLHAVPERQAFDAAALAGRLGLPEGEPWRLALTARADAALGGSESDPEPQPPPSPLPLASLRLTGFEALAGRADGQALDPLRTLLAPPRGGLAPGQRVDLLYWRPRSAYSATPGRAARGASEPSACTLSATLGEASLEVVLSPTRLAEPGTSDSLARLPEPSREERSR